MNMFKKSIWICFFIFYTLTTFPCEITTTSVIDSKNPQNSPAMFEIAQDCTEQNIVDYYEKLSPDYQKRFKNTLALYFNRSSLSPTIKSRQDFINKYLPDLFFKKIDQLKTSVVTLGPSASIKDAGKFKQIFEFNYSQSSTAIKSFSQIAQSAKPCCYIGSSQDALTPSNAIEITESLNNGYSNLTIFQGSNLENFGKHIVSNIRALFNTPPSDRITEKVLAEQRGAIIKSYESYNRSVADYTNNVAMSSLRYSIVAQLLSAETTSIWQSLNESIAKTAKEFEETFKELNARHEKIIAEREAVENILTEEDQKREDVKNGLYPKVSLEKIRNDLYAGLMQASNENPTAGLDQLMSRLDFTYTLDNPKKSQLQNLLKEHLDDRGIVAAYAGIEPRLDDRVLYTDAASNRNMAYMLRRNINRALALETFSTSPVIQKQAKEALMLSLTGDNFTHLGMNQVAQELIANSMEMLAYAANDGDLNYFKRHYPTSNAINIYNINVSPDTFANYKIIQYANKFAENATIQNNPYLKFYSHALIQQNLQASKQGSSEYLKSIVDTELFLEATKGIVSGITQFTVDTTTGIVHLVTSPIESAQAIVNTLWNLDKVWLTLNTKITSVYNEFPNYSIEEKSKFITEATLNILTAILPIADVSKIASGTIEFSKFAESTQILTEYAYRGMAGLERAESIAPGYLNLFSEIEKHAFINGALEIGNNLHSASPEFIHGLMNYAKQNALETKEIAAISRFEGGFSKFMSESEYRKYILSDQYNFFGKPPEHKIFVTSRIVADQIVYKSYETKNKAFIRNIMGLSEEAWKEGEKLYRIDIPFSFNYTPRLPTGTEAGANMHYVHGLGWTTGGAPELILKNTPKADIIGGYKSGFQIIYD